LVYADDVNILGGNVHSVKKKHKTVVVVIKGVDYKLNADKLCTWSCLEIRMQGEVTIYKEWQYFL